MLKLLYENIVKLELEEPGCIDIRFDKLMARCAQRNVSSLKFNDLVGSFEFGPNASEA